MPAGHADHPAPRESPLPTMSVVLCAFAEDRFELLREAVESVQRQSYPPLEIIVVVDHNDALLARVRRELSGVHAIANEEPAGDSGARNTGTRHARGEVIACLDDDARAARDWLEQIACHYDDPRVFGTGGSIDPRWLAPAPRWLPQEFHWVLSCTYRGLPTEVAPIRNPIGANMSFRRSVLLEEGGFPANIVRVGTDLRACSETEFPIRVQARHPDALVLHIPDARVDHAVPAERTTWSYYRSRCWAEGRGKALVTSAVGAGAGLSSERAYVRRTLPRGVWRGLLEGVRGDRYGFARAAAIVAGLAITTAGYAYGRGERLLAALRRGAS